MAITSHANRGWEKPIAVRWLLGGFLGLAQIRSFNFKNGRHAGLPLAVLKDLATRPLLHAGAYALCADAPHADAPHADAPHADAPHWEAMRRWQALILRRGKPFTSDQLAMALAIYTDGLSLQLLPETCNYIHRWLFDSVNGTLVENWYPYPRIGIVHLAGQKRMRFDPEAAVEVVGLDGRAHMLSLR